MKRTILLVLFIFSIGAQQVFAQKMGQARIDSLLSVLSKSKEDTNKVNTLFQLTGVYVNYFYQKEIKDSIPKEYLYQALKIAKKTNSKKKQADCYDRFAMLNSIEGNKEKTIEYYLASLKIATELGDKKRIATTNISLGESYNEAGYYDKALEMFLASLKILEELGDKKGVAQCYNNLGLTYDRKKNTLKKTECFLGALKTYNEINDTNGIAQASTLLAVEYFDQGNYEKALETYFISIKTYQAQGKKSMVANFTSTSIAYIYQQQKNYAKALETYLVALKIYKELGDKSGTADTYERIGWLYLDGLHNYEKALENFSTALKLYEELGAKGNIANSYDNLASTYSKLHNKDKALEYYLASLKLYQELGDKHGLSQEYYSIGDNYETDGKYDKALENYLSENKIAEDKSDKALSYKNLARIYFKKNKFNDAKEQSLLYLKCAKELQSNSQLKNSYHLLSQCDSALSNWKGAYAYHKLFKELSDSVDNIEFIKKSAEMTSKYESGKSDSEIKFLAKEKENQLALSAAESKKQKLIILFVAIGLLIVMVFAGFIFRSLRITNKQKDIIEEKNREITDSIEYALRIQTAILPPTRIVKQYLENSFILYKPKDIVAGDFYWMETVQLDNVPISQLTNETNQLILFAACDCTGHGVPGAMVSVVCHNALNRAVREFGLTEPAKILDKTAEIVIENFSKSEEEIKDGMDISLCCLSPTLSEGEGASSYKLEWAGANNPLWLLQNGEIKETKADKQPIGMNEDSKPFTNHTFTLNSGDTIYIFTDGFADQFGGDTGEKKLTKKRFKDLILSIQDKSMQEQGIALDKFITDYRNVIEQIDDILVLGVRV